MKTDSDRVRAIIVECLERPLGELALDPCRLPADFDLMAGGLVDSLGFVELLSQLDARLGVELDFGDLEPGQLTRLDTLASHVASQLRARRGSHA